MDRGQARSRSPRRGAPTTIPVATTEPHSEPDSPSGSRSVRVQPLQTFTHMEVAVENALVQAKERMRTMEWALESLDDSMNYFPEAHPIQGSIRAHLEALHANLRKLKASLNSEERRLIFRSSLRAVFP